MIPFHFWSALGVVIGMFAVWTFLAAFRKFRSDNLSLADKTVMPLMKYDGQLPGMATREGESHRKKEAAPRNEGSHQPPAKHYVETKHNPREALEAILLVSAIAGDFCMIVLGFALSNLLCRSNLIPSSLTGVSAPAFGESYPLILCASAVVLWGLKGKDLYLYRSLLVPAKIWHRLFGALGFCLCAFIGVSLVVRTAPPIPWLFFVCAALIICPVIYGWRVALSAIIHQPALASRLRRRMIVIGGGSQTMRIQKALGEKSDMEFVGWVQANKPNLVAEIEKFRLGSLHELGAILRKNAVDVAVLTESESLQREGVLAVAKACENEHVQFKMVPHFFEILVSGVRPENIGGMHLLGVHCLPLYGFRNRFVKRAVDIFGALIGLAISTPVIIFFGGIVYWESPGPIFYRQIRQGRNGRLFHIIKIRSMRINAESNGEAKWAQQNDNRRLRIGTFMRKYNIDEVPQFWNVLRGQMSLVGPRPERPELIAHFKSKIPHYQARHIYQPGMTGWAQINGWRGNTCLEERIRHDIWYLENWSVWLDFRIMVQTFFRQKNAY